MDSSKSIEPIQHLRGIAALGVVLFHSLSQTHAFEGGAAYIRMGAAGVDLFFVISGFIMWVTAASRDTAHPGNFAVKRLIRIVPLYWLATTFVLVIVLVAPSLMRSASFDAAHVAASYAFVAWPHPKFDSRLWPLVVPGWTLNYEMVFYAIVTASLFLKRALRPWVIGAAIIALVLLGLLLQPTSILAFYTDQILLEFLFGVAIGVAYTRAVSLSRSVACAMLVIAILAFLALGPGSTSLNRALTWGVPMALLVFSAVNLKTFLPRRLFRRLGDASYSIYLTQFCTIAPAAKFLAALTDTTGERMLATVALTLIATCAGVAGYCAVERPITDALRRVVDRPADSSVGRTLMRAKSM